MNSKNIALALLAFAFSVSVCADELRIIIAPTTSYVTQGGRVAFDVYTYNASKQLTRAPNIEADYSVSWTLRDVNGIRPQRERTDVIVGTDTVKHVVLKPWSVASGRLLDIFPAEPGDLLEFYVSLDVKDKVGKVRSIRSNALVMYFPK